MFCHKINRLTRRRKNSRSKEKQLLTSMRGDLPIACHALMDILVKEIVVWGLMTGERRAEPRRVEPM
jgi:hypothetical protein